MIAFTKAKVFVAAMNSGEIHSNRLEGAHS